MRCILIFVLALSFVNTSPTRNSLKDDLRKAAEETASLIRREGVRCLIEIFQKVIDSQHINEKDISKWQAVQDKFVHLHETWAENGEKIENVLREADKLEPKLTSLTELNYYTNGGFNESQAKNKELKTQLYAEFVTKANDMIRLSKEAGYTDTNLDAFYNKFVENPNKINQLISKLFQYN
ncbi:uncharacterized protein LOC132798760 [Drosophila nasuta]|uniref:uncharacterized protein LOC132798760 n=1 Tax=Drosophila nasuta TaxID=42062 RepID=UPI00295E8427|nr:uncharacterized protein LOC132798760 [Drosophila nasuta]